VNSGASKRLLEKIRDEHPHWKLIVVEDGLASNAPHIRLLKRLNMRFLLGAKPDDHEHLFEAVSQAEAEGRVTTLRWTDDTKKEEVECEIRFVNQLPLNKSNADLLVNFLQYTEYAADGSIRKRFSWVTDLTITSDNARHFQFTSMRHLHEVMLYDLAKELPVPTFSSRGRARVP